LQETLPIYNEVVAEKDKEEDMASGSCFSEGNKEVEINTDEITTPNMLDKLDEELEDGEYIT